VEGSTFSRGFRVRFRAPIQDVLKWLGDSPGPRETAPERLGETLLRYRIRPGGGAQHAEVVVDQRSGLVEIYSFWS
jgi:hypothetical protein